MSVELDDKSHDFEPENKLVIAIKALDDSRGVLFTQASSYASKPSPDGVDRMADAASGLSLSMQEALSAVLDDGEIEQSNKAGIIASLLKQEDTERVLFFSRISNGAFKEEKHSRQDMTVIVDEIISEADSKMEIVGAIIDEFDSALTVDFDTFFNTVRSSRNFKLRALSRLIGKHALDISKISLGVGAGAAIAHYARWM